MKNPIILTTKHNQIKFRKRMPIYLKKRKKDPEAMLKKSHLKSQIRS